MEEPTLSLYSLAVSSLTSATAFSEVLSKKDLIPETVFVEMCLKKVETGYNTADIQQLHEELCQVPTFFKLLSIKGAREGCVRRLWKLVIDGVIRKDEGIVLREEVLPSRLASGFQKEMENGGVEIPKPFEMRKALADFLYEMGWFKEAATVLKICLENSPGGDDKQSYVLLARLLSAQVKYSQYDEAKASRTRALELIENLELINPNVAEIAELYSALSRLSSFESKYKESFELSMKALEAMRAFPEHYVIHHVAAVEILCQGSVACLNVLEFGKAKVLIKGALCLSKEVCGSKSTAYADALHVYGKYLVDQFTLHEAVETFEKCLEIRSEAFGYFNLITAVTKLDLGDAVYQAHPYRPDSRGYVSSSLEILESLLPPTHLQFSTINKLRSLLLLDQDIPSLNSSCLMMAEMLQENALSKLIAAFGEENLEVGHHFTFLGKLYLYMKKPDEAEVKLLKGISIMDSVAFKGSHKRLLVTQLRLLAFLYERAWRQPEKADPLVLRAIDTCKECFGEFSLYMQYVYRNVLVMYSESDRRHREISEKLAEIQGLEDAGNHEDEGETENSSGRRVSTILESFFIGESLTDN